MPEQHHTLRLAMAVSLGLLMAGCGGEQQPPQHATTPPAPAVVDTQATGFANPPNEARTRVWWHWMNGNVTQDGIGKDLAWMQRIGIGGLQNFDAAMETLIVVDKRLPPAWHPWINPVPD